jgi:hypothetical protein
MYANTLHVQETWVSQCLKIFSHEIDNLAFTHENMLLLTANNVLLI